MMLNPFMATLDRHLEEKGAALDPMLQELAFGYGPRQCIGMRLALLELKFAAVTLIRKFRFLKSPDIPVRDLDQGSSTRGPILKFFAARKHILAALLFAARKSLYVMNL